MGKPATTYFCGNGHLLEHNPHHHFGDYDFGLTLKQPCKYCQSTEVLCTIEWLDDDYEQKVPANPIRFDSILLIKGQPRKKIPVYDISKLKSRRWKSKMQHEKKDNCEIHD